MRNSNSLVLVILVAACGGGGSKTPVTTPVTPAPGAAPGLGAPGTYPVADLPAGVPQCWAGDGTAETAQGNSSTFRQMLRRSFVAGTSTIHEDAVTAAIGQPSTRQSSEYKVSGQTAAVSGQYAGTAEFVGEPTNWTSWTTTVSVPAGKQTMTVKSVSTLKGTTIHTEATVMDGTNTPIVQFISDLQPLDEAACKAEFSKAPPKA